MKDMRKATHDRANQLTREARHTNYGEEFDSPYTGDVLVQEITRLIATKDAQDDARSPTIQEIVSKASPNASLHKVIDHANQGPQVTHFIPYEEREAYHPQDRIKEIARITGRPVNTFAHHLPIEFSDEFGTVITLEEILSGDVTQGAWIRKDTE